MAVQAATTAELVSGPFVLGIDSGAVHLARTRTAFDLPDRPVIPLMRDYLTIVRGLLDGDSVEYQGRITSLHGVQLGFGPPRVPLYVGGLGPHVLSLAGELADGWASCACASTRMPKRHAGRLARRYCDTGWCDPGGARTEGYRGQFWAHGFRRCFDGAGGASRLWRQHR